MDENHGENIETTETVGTPTPAPSKSVGREIGEWVLSIVIALAIALLLRNFVFTLVRVDGSSMLPTLHSSERLIVVRLGYTPSSGDIVIFDPPNGRGPYVKRVIGMPGQTVKIDNETGDVFVDGEKLDEPYINNKTTSSATEFVVPDNCIFAMGDNRSNSHDSRAADVGFVPFNKVMGKAVFRLWPLNMFGSIK